MRESHFVDCQRQSGIQHLRRCEKDNYVYLSYHFGCEAIESETDYFFIAAGCVQRQLHDVNARFCDKTLQRLQIREHRMYYRRNIFATRCMRRLLEIVC